MEELQIRLKDYLNHIGIPMQTFERKANIGQGLGRKLSTKSYATTFKRIEVAFPDLNIEWLRTGKGDMLKPQPAESYEIGVGVGKQQGGKSEFKVEIKEDDQERKSDEQTTTDLRRDIDLLKSQLQDRERTIETLTASVARLEKVNDFLMQQISQK